MSKKLILVLLLKTIFLFAQDKDTEKKDLKGNVKEVKYYRNNILHESYEFNKNGFFTKHKYFTNNKPRLDCEWTYNKEGNILMIKGESNTTNYKYNNEEKVIQVTYLQGYKKDTTRNYQYEYTGKNLIKTIGHTYSKRDEKTFDKVLLDKTLFEYDSINRLEREINYGASAVFIEKPIYPSKEMENRIPIIYLYKYDLSNNLIEKVGSPENRNEISSKYSFKYDSKNNKIEDRTEWPNNSASGYETYVYDDKNNLIERLKYNIYDEFLSKLVYTYDNNRNQLSKTGYVKGELKWSIESKYDLHNNKIEEREYNKGNLYNIKHRKFDDFGNEIQLKITDNKGKTLYDFKTEIIYY